jgi:hypothetical protein
MENEYLKLLQGGRTAPNGNPYLDKLAVDADEQNTRMRGTLNATVDSNPEKEALSRRVAGYLGTTPPVVQALPKEADRAAKVKEIETNTVNAPALRRMYSDADFAKLAHDDSGVLSKLERTLKFLVSAPGEKHTLMGALGGGLAAANTGAAGLFRGGFELAAPVLDPLVGKILPQNPLRVGADWFAKASKISKANEDRLSPPTDGTIMGGVQSGIKSFAANTLALPLAFLPGGQAAALTMMTGQTGGNAYNDARAKGLSPIEALPFAVSQATIEYATEKLPLGILVKDLAKNASLRSTIVNQLKAEIPGEQVATVLQDLNEWAVLNPSKPFADYLAERPNAAAQTLIATVIGVGGNVALGKSIDSVLTNAQEKQQRAQTAMQFPEQLKEFGQIVAASKTYQRTPDVFEKFIEQATQDGPVQDVYINAQALAQSEFVNDLAKASPAIAAQLETALATGNDVRVPLAEYAANIAPTAWHESLADHIKTDPADFTKVEADAYMQSQSAALADDFGNTINSMQDSGEFKASAEAVKTNIRGQLDTANRFTPAVNDAYASMVSNFFAVTSAKLGMTPEALYQRYPLRVQAEGTGGFQQDKASREQRALDMGYISESQWEQLSGKIQRSGMGETSGQSAVNSGTRSPSGGNTGRLQRFYHGTRDDVNAFDLKHPNRKDHGWLGTGVYITDDANLANEYATKRGDGAPNVMPLNVQLKNPYVATLEFKQRMAKLKPEFAQRVTNKLIALGHDGVVLRYDDETTEAVVFNPASVRSTSAQFDSKKAGSTDLLAQGRLGAERDLVLTHNLTADNILHAQKMGGIAVPSLAITKKDNPLTGFGEITLIGNQGMADPKGYASTRVFGADIYSPRYPNVERELDKAGWVALNKKLRSMAERMGTSPPDASELERDAQREMERNLTVMGQFLLEQGTEPTLVYRPGMTPEREARLTEFGLGAFLGNTDSVALLDDPAFFSAALAEITSMYELSGKRDVFVRSLKTDKMVQRNMVRDLAREVANAAKLKQRPEIDNYETRKAMESQIADKGIGSDFQQYVADLVEGVTKSERIFQGFTYSGNRKYIPHTLENVVKLLKKELRGGESFSYGVGSLRAQFTPQFKTVAQIKANKDRLIPAAQFETLKAEIDAEFVSVMGGISPDLSLDTGISILEDAAKKGVKRAAKEYGYEASDAAIERANDFIDKLRNMPTAYFEAKILRDVDLAKFAGAVVPEGVNPKAIDALKARGITDIKTYKKGDEVDRAAKIGEFSHLFFQGPRGSFNPETLTTTLLKSADLSTFLHESGHFFLEVQLDLASQSNAPQELIDDAQTLIKWFGVDSLATWNSYTLEQKREHHETFARGFESYLFEGNAPNLEMQNIFHRFRAWLLNIYRDLKALNVELTPDVRQVMDRMMASAEQIQFAEQNRSMAPLFSSAEQAGLDTQSFKAYHDLGIASTNEAIESLQAKGLRDMQWLANTKGREIAKLKKRADTLRGELAVFAREEVMAEPVYQAWAYLANKESPKLNTDALTDMYGGEGDKYALHDWKRLQDYRMTSRDGIHPDVAAELLGFQSGDELVKAITGAPKPADAIEAATDVLMLERHGELSSPEALAREADKAIHNDVRARMVATELNALDEAVNVRADAGTDKKGRKRTFAVLPAAAKQFAAATIQRLQIRNLRPAQYAAAQARASKASEAALKKGDMQAAATEKRNQLINLYTAKAAYQAQDDIEQALNYLKKFNSDIKGIDVDYMDQIHALLERFDLREISLKAIDRRAALRDWLDAKEKEGIAPDIPEALINEAYRTPYKQLTVEEFNGVVDAVKQIEHLGRLKNKLLTAKDDREYAAIRDAIADGIITHAGNREANTRSPATRKERSVSWLKHQWAAHIKVATWARIMDGGQDGGPVWNYFVRSANEKGDQETAMRAEATKQLTEIMKPIFAAGKVEGKREHFPSVDRSFHRGERIAIALNYGNAGNKQRLLDGEGWSEYQIGPVLSSLTAADWQTVQGIWDYLETYKPLIGAKERRIYGREPAWVEAEPFAMQTADGQTLNLRGGYYPVKYDPQASQRAEEHADAEDAKRQLKGAYTSATTRRSFTKARAEAVKQRPLLYSLDGVYSGVNDVIHDLSWHEWLIDVNRLMRSSTIDNAIRDHYGPGVKQQFKTWINDIAEGDKGADGMIDVAMSRLRKGVSAAGLGFNVMSAAMQPLGFTQSIIRVGPTYMGRGIQKFIASPVESAREVAEKSSFMANRSRTRFRELNEIRNKVENETQLEYAIKTGTFYLMMRGQQLVDVPTWLAGYEKAIANGAGEEAAISLADQGVIDAQGGGQLKDLSAIERGGPTQKLFTVFYSFMNTALNLGVAQTMNAKTPGQKAKLAVDYLMLYSVPAVLGFALKEVLTPGGGDEDGEGIMKKLLAAQIDYLMGLMVVVREFAEAGKLLTGANDKGRDYTGPAGLRAITDTITAAKQAAQGEFDTQFRKAMVNAIGSWFGLPAAQVNRTITGVGALADGETDNPGAVLFGYQK